MTTSIFIRTYDKDAAWLRFCLRSLRMFATGFDETVVVTPKESDHAIRPLAEEFGCRYGTCPRLSHDDYIGQQATKMTADNWCSGDIICFVDSDQVFRRPMDASDFVDKDGKVAMLKTRYSEIECPWQPVTSRIVGFPVEYEYMRRLPLAYPRNVLFVARRHIEGTHHMAFEDFIRRVPRREFSEFNVLGAAAEAFCPDQFTIRDTATVPDLPPPFSRQFWSWGGVTPEIEREIETILTP